MDYEFSPEADKEPLDLLAEVFDELRKGTTIVAAARRLLQGAYAGWLRSERRDHHWRHARQVTVLQEECATPDSVPRILTPGEAEELGRGIGALEAVGLLERHTRRTSPLGAELLATAVRLCEVIDRAGLAATTSLRPNRISDEYPDWTPCLGVVWPATTVPLRVRLAGETLADTLDCAAAMRRGGVQRRTTRLLHWSRPGAGAGAWSRECGTRWASSEIGGPEGGRGGQRQYPD